MKKLILVSGALFLSVLVGGCGFTTVSFFLVTKEGAPADAQKTECGDFLIPATVSNFASETLDNTLKQLWIDQSKEYPNLSTSSLFKNGAIILEDVSQPATITFKDPLRVYIKTGDAKKVTEADHCEVVRFKDQLKKTIDVYASTRPRLGIQPYQIVFDGNAKNWECLGVKSEFCSKK